MKIYISADIEGVCGIAHWDEAKKGGADYEHFKRQMTAEVAVVCKSLLENGANEILVKDAHGTGRNIDHSELPTEARLIRGWSGHPYSMIQEIDSSFDALVMIGFHSAAGSASNPLAHTMAGRFHKMELNGKVLSEFYLHSLMATELGVPTIMVSGDSGLCQHVAELSPNTLTVATTTGVGDSVISKHPNLAFSELAKTAANAIKKIEECKMKSFDEYLLNIEYKKADMAYRASFYPGVEQISDHQVTFKSHRVFEVMRALKFI